VYPILNLFFRHVAGRPTPWFLLGVAAFLYLNLFVWPDIPVYRFPNEPIYLLSAMKMFEGQKMYRDFFQFTFPGAAVVYAALFHLFGVRAWIPNAVFVALGTGLAGLSVVICRKLMKGAAVFVPGLLFLTFAFRLAADDSHHYYAVLGILAALALILEHRSGSRLAGAGACCGLASFFSQGHGLMGACGLGVFLLWEWRRKRLAWNALIQREACLFGAFLATLTASSAYFIATAGQERFVFCTVLFVIQYWPLTEWSGPQVYLADPPPFLPWSMLPKLGLWLFLHALIPLVYLLVFLRYRRTRDREAESWDRLLLVNLTGLFLFLGVAPSPGYTRLCAVSLPAFIVLVWLLQTPQKLARVFSAVLCLGALLLAVGEPLRVQNQKRWQFLDAPSGRLALEGSNVFDEYEWLLRVTRPRAFAFASFHPEVYFALHLRNPTEVPFVLNTGYTRPEQVRNVVESLERRRVRFVLWSKLSESEFGRRAQGNHLEPLLRYLRSRYRPVKSFPDLDEVWERSE